MRQVVPRVILAGTFRDAAWSQPRLRAEHQRGRPEQGTYALHFGELIRYTVVDSSWTYEGQTTPTKLMPDMSATYDWTFAVR